MLSKKEQAVMTYLFGECVDKDSTLISPQQITTALMPKYELNSIEIDQIINALMLDDYIEAVSSDSKGRLVYCIKLKQKGESYLREKTTAKKTATMLIVRTVLLAILSFVVGVILKAIFQG